MTATTVPPAIDLSMNEGEPPPRACFGVLERIGPGILRKYAGAAPLEAAYANYLGIESECVLATTGGDDAIDRVLRAFLSPGREMVFPTPTFEMIPSCARMARGRLVPVKYDWGTLPHDEILDRVGDATGVVAVITPDNPTGHAFSTRALLSLACALPPGVIFMVDSAYAEFADDDPTEALLEVPHAVMIRTMSKSWGLAGLRVGFAVGAPEQIRRLRGFGGPYALTGPSVAIALDRLENGEEEMWDFVAHVRSRRGRLAEVVRRAGGEPQPSQTNFVLAGFPDARWVHRGLGAQGIRVRYFPHLPEHVRITVPRNDAEFRRLECALDALQRPGALIFDMDGVLADVGRSYREAIIRTCSSYRVRVDNRAINACKAAGNTNSDWRVTQLLLAARGIEASLAEVTERFEAVYQGTEDAPGLRRHETLIPHRELIEELACTFPLGIVTGRPRADAERFLRDEGIRGCFRVVVCAEDAPLKPDPAPVQLALEALDERTAWMLGDTPDDVRAAVGAGVVPVGVVPPGGGREVWGALEVAGAARIVQAGAHLGGLFDGGRAAGR